MPPARYARVGHAPRLAREPLGVDPCPQMGVIGEPLGVLRVRVLVAELPGWDLAIQGPLDLLDVVGDHGVSLRVMDGIGRIVHRDRDRGRACAPDLAPALGGDLPGDAVNRLQIDVPEEPPGSLSAHGHDQARLDLEQLKLQGLDLGVGTAGVRCYHGLAEVGDIDVEAVDVLAVEARVEEAAGGPNPDPTLTQLLDTRPKPTPERHAGLRALASNLATHP